MGIYNFTVNYTVLNRPVALINYSVKVIDCSLKVYPSTPVPPQNIPIGYSTTFNYTTFETFEECNNPVYSASCNGTSLPISLGGGGIFLDTSLN
jgi:hypothetical protein